MATVEFQFSSPGFRKLGKRVGDIKRRFFELEKVLGPAAQDIKENVILAGFRSGTSPEGKPWAPLSPKTLQARRRKGIAGVKPLIATGKLMSQVFGEADGRTVLFGVRGDREKVVTTHNFGRGNVPARPFLPFAPGGLATATGRMAEWVSRTSDKVVNWVLHGKLD